MKNVHIVVPDLFLPQEIAADACAGLHLPMLEKLLARAQSAPLPTDNLETWLCGAFGVEGQAIAPVTLLTDGMQPGAAYWLRADPVHIQMRREQMVLQADVPINADEAAQLCAGLNAHFAVDGLRFFAPHPQRWYLRLDTAPDIVTRPVAQVAGKNVHAHLPQGPDALRWHSVFNEIQMLFFEHAVNQAREARGEFPINGVWLWGGGSAAGPLARPYSRVCGDSPLVAAFAQAAGIPLSPSPVNTPSPFGRGHGERDGRGERDSAGEGNVLFVWEGLRSSLQQDDLHAWRVSVQRFEQACAAPLWAALRAGHITQLTLDVLNAGDARRFELTRSAAWKLWCRPKSLMRYAVV